MSDTERTLIQYDRHKMEQSYTEGRALHHLLTRGIMVLYFGKIPLRWMRRLPPWQPGVRAWREAKAQRRNLAP